MFVCLVLSQANFGDLSPFLFAFLFAGLYVGINKHLISAFVLISAVCSSSTIEALMTALTVVAIGLIVAYIHKFIKRRIHLATIFCTYALSLVTYIYYHFKDLKHCAFYVVLGLVCVFVYISVLQVLILRNNCFKLTLDESVCFLFAIASLGLGFASMFVFEFSVARFVAGIIMLLCISVGSPGLSYAIVLAFCLGCSLQSLNLNLLAEFMILAMLASMFPSPNKFKIILTIVLSDVIIQYCFISKNFEILINLTPILVSGLIFLLISNKFLRSLSDLVYVKKSEITSRNAINTTRKNIKKRMVDLSNVFLDMKQIHLGMTKKELSKEELV